VQPQVDLDRQPAATARLIALYDHALPVVFGYCRARLPLHDAEDLCAEVFQAAAEALAADPDRDLTTSWLVTVARNRVIDRWRREARWAARLPILAATEAPVEIVPDDDDVLAALDCLTLTQRAAVVLRWMEDRPVAEVARMLGRSEHATESVLRRARIQLRSNLNRKIS